jgi:hypothetical protein
MENYRLKAGLLGVEGRTLTPAGRSGDAAAHIDCAIKDTDKKMFPVMDSLTPARRSVCLCVVFDEEVDEVGDHVADLF